MHHKFYLGDVIDCLKTIPDNTVQCVVTSPPYFGLRDYNLPPTEWPEVTFIPVAGLPAIKIQPVICCHGLEPDPWSFIGHEVLIFREIFRILRSDGSLWMNFGDSYCANGKGSFKKYNDCKSKNLPRGSGRWGGGNNEVAELKVKDLIGIPWSVAKALQADGFYLRSDIIWSKPNPMPSSIKDRPTSSHEYIFLLSKKAHYYYDNEAIKEPIAESTIGRGAVDFGGEKGRNYKPEKGDPNYRGGNEQWGRTYEYKEGGRNKRTVWEIATESFSGAHFATFPRALVEPCVLAGTSPKACPKCRAPWKRVLEPSEDYKKFLGKSYHDHSNDIYQGLSQKKVFPRTFADYNTVDWVPTCKCEGNDGTGKCIVLDPFGGSGTVTYVASCQGRDSYYIDLNSKYLDIALDRNGFNGLCHADTYEIIRVPSLGEAINQ